MTAKRAVTVSSSISSLPLRFLPLVVIAAVLAGPGCECRPPERAATGARDAEPTNRLTVTPAPRDDRAWTPAERHAIGKLTAAVTEYYPAWAPERESADDYFARFEDAPETLRLQALIRHRVDRDRNRWRACLADVRAALGAGDGVGRLLTSAGPNGTDRISDRGAHRAARSAVG